MVRDGAEPAVEELHRGGVEVELHELVVLSEIIQSAHNDRMT